MEAPLIVTPSSVTIVVPDEQLQVVNAAPVAAADSDSSKPLLMGEAVFLGERGGGVTAPEALAVPEALVSAALRAGVVHAPHSIPINTLVFLVLELFRSFLWVQPLGIGAATTLIVFLLRGNVIGLGFLTFVTSLPIMISMSSFKFAWMSLQLVLDASWVAGTYVRREVTRREVGGACLYEFSVDGGETMEHARTQWLDEPPEEGSPALVVFNPSHSPEIRARASGVIVCCRLDESGRLHMQETGKWHKAGRLLEFVCCVAASIVIVCFVGGFVVVGGD